MEVTFGHIVFGYIILTVLIFTYWLIRYLWNRNSDSTYSYSSKRGYSYNENDFQRDFQYLQDLFYRVNRKVKKVKKDLDALEYSDGELRDDNETNKFVQKSLLIELCSIYRKNDLIKTYNAFMRRYNTTQQEMEYQFPDYKELIVLADRCDREEDYEDVDNASDKKIDAANILRKILRDHDEELEDLFEEIEDLDDDDYLRKIVEYEVCALMFKENYFDEKEKYEDDYGDDDPFLYYKLRDYAEAVTKLNDHYSKCKDGDVKDQTSAMEELVDDIMTEIKEKEFTNTKISSGLCDIITSDIVELISNYKDLVGNKEIKLLEVNLYREGLNEDSIKSILSSPTDCTFTPTTDPASAGPATTGPATDATSAGPATDATSAGPATDPATDPASAGPASVGPAT